MPRLDRRARADAAAWLLLAGLASPAAAQAPSPSPSPSPAGPTLQRPPMPPMETAVKQATLAGPGRSAAESWSEAGPLAELRAISIGEGEARVEDRGGVRTLRPGDALGRDVVKAIGDGRIVLARTDPTAGEATVVVLFDAQGRARVRVIWERDPAARRAGAR